MKKIRIHPLTIPVFLIMLFIDNRHLYFVLYIFIFLHELSHMLCAYIFKIPPSSIHLYPWGCMLSLSRIPCKKKHLLILLSGPLFNLIMFLSGIFPKENLSLFLFNLIPVIPLDGGVILNILCPSHSYILSLIFIISLHILCLKIHILPLMPLLFLLIHILTFGKQRKKLIDIKVMDYLAKNNVENKGKKLYNIKIEK